MDLLIVPVPIFDENTEVLAYYIRYRRGNGLLAESKESIHMADALHSPAIDMMKNVSMEAISMGEPVFVPINKFILLMNIEAGWDHPANKIIFVLDADFMPEAAHISSIKRLMGLGYRFGVRNAITAIHPLLEYADFVFFDYAGLENPANRTLRAAIETGHPNAMFVYTGIRSKDDFAKGKSKLKGLYEGSFYRTNAGAGGKISPLQVNMVNLVNKVSAEDFAFDQVAKIIQRDPALTVSLIKLANSAFMRKREKVKSISNAVVMLGEEQVRKWIMAASTSMMGSEKPNEVTRLSLIRAKFAESLAGPFEMAIDAESLFLTGLFSVLDAILEMPIENALKVVCVTDAIYDSIVTRSGPYADVYELILQYESANWNAVSRMLILHDISAEDVYNAYLDALYSYQSMLGGDEQY